MRTGEVKRIADRIAADDRSAKELLVAAVELALSEGLSGDEIVELIDELERRLGMEIHPVRFRR